MHLIYLTFGENVNNHTQAQFSICSFLARNQSLLSVHVFTDQPDFYINLSDRVDIIKINEQILNDWKGQFNFFWRIKIKAIEMICNQYKNEPVLYLDSDTFLYKNISELGETLDTGIAVMHQNEGRLSEASSKTEKKMWSQVKNNFYANIQISDSHAMWNAGVVATPNKKNGKEISDALKICDEMCGHGVTRRLVEQFALSVALHENYGLTAAESHIAHYWSNKESWNKLIIDFFVKAYFKSSSFTELLKQAEVFDYTALPVKLKVKNTKVRLVKLLEKIFPDKEFSYINKQS